MHEGNVIELAAGFKFEFITYKLQILFMSEAALAFGVG